MTRKRTVLTAFAMATGVLVAAAGSAVAEEQRATGGTDFHQTAPPPDFHQTVVPADFHQTDFHQTDVPRTTGPADFHQTDFHQTTVPADAPATARV